MMAIWFLLNRWPPCEGTKGRAVRLFYSFTSSYVNEHRRKTKKHMSRIHINNLFNYSYTSHIFRSLTSTHYSDGLSLTASIGEVINYFEFYDEIVFFTAYIRILSDWLPCAWRTINTQCARSTNKYAVTLRAHSTN